MCDNFTTTSSIYECLILALISCFVILSFFSKKEFLVEPAINLLNNNVADFDVAKVSNKTNI